MSRRALVVIDMQQDLCRDLRRREKVDAILAPLRRAIAAFAERNDPVLYVCFALRPDDEQFRRFGDHYCIEGTPGAEIIPELLPRRGPIIKKTKHSAFFETTLDETLRAAGVSDVYLAGLQTQICIMTTAADASFRGYRAIALRDCVVSTREESKEQALNWIAKYVGEVRTVDEVLSGDEVRI